MAWVSFNDIYVNKAGGSVSGNLSVNGALNINSGKGDGSTYNVATQLTNLNNNKAAVSHTHSATDITGGTLDLSHLPTIPVSKGGTGATTASGALTNLGAASADALKELQDSVSPMSLDAKPLVTMKSGYRFNRGVVVIMGNLMQLHIEFAPEINMKANDVFNLFRVDDSIHANENAIIGNDYTSGHIAWDNCWCSFSNAITAGTNVSITSGVYFHY